MYRKYIVYHPENAETWLDNEESCYPSGRMIRRGKCIFPDGVIRSIRCGIPDTYFTIPAYARKSGKYIRGYVTSAENGYTFNPNKPEGK
jgi:hypothetical protein